MVDNLTFKNIDFSSDQLPEFCLKIIGIAINLLDFKPQDQYDLKIKVSELLEPDILSTQSLDELKTFVWKKLYNGVTFLYKEDSMVPTIAAYLLFGLIHYKFVPSVVSKNNINFIFYSSLIAQALAITQRPTYAAAPEYIYLGKFITQLKAKLDERLSF